MSKPVTVAIVDDSSDLRENIAGYVNAAPGFRCVRTYASAEQALGALAAEPPDVVLMDINLGHQRLDGIGCVRRLKALAPGTQILMLTVFEDTDKIFDALAAGASGYLLKRMPPCQLLEAIREVMAGGAPMSTPIARKVVQSFQAPAVRQDQVAKLSEREQDVLSGLARGLEYKEIGDQLGLSIHSVRNYIRRIYEKLQVHCRTDAVVKFLKQ
jgi:DNA-binding NarL/FixJ family response regulator